MKGKKNNKYYRFKKTLIAGASSGIVAGLILMGSSNVAYAELNENSAQYTPVYNQDTTGKGMHMMHRWNSKPKINSLAAVLGLDENEVRNDLKSGKKLKQILQENGIEPSQLEKAFESKKNKRGGKMWKRHMDY